MRAKGLLVRVILAATAVSPPLLAEPVRPLLRDFIAINGHTVQFKPDLYQPIGRHVRDYHPVAWDLGNNTAEPAPFPFAKNRVDWSKVYGSWQNKGWVTDACLMFESIPRADWNDLEKDAASYASAFAREFGPGGRHPLVESVEIGNEPGKWSDVDYTRVFRTMAGAIRRADPKLRIATCNLTTGASGNYEKSVDCIKGCPEMVDVLTVHSYAQLTGWPTWKRSYPEDPALPKYLRDIEDLCKWRDAHMPGKPVWITEFGYDSTTKPQEKSGDFTKWEGVTDVQQAQWLVRSLLVFSSMPVERAYIYFFNDEDKPSLHASAGLTRHFKPKPSFHAVRHLQSALGEYRFRRIVLDQSGNLRVHEYQHGNDPAKRVWVVWRPVGDSKPEPVTLDGVPGRVVSASRMPLADSPVENVDFTRPSRGKVSLEVGTSPVYLELAP